MVCVWSTAARGQQEAFSYADRARGLRLPHMHGLRLTMCTSSESGLIRGINSVCDAFGM